MSQQLELEEPNPTISKDTVAVWKRPSTLLPLRGILCDRHDGLCRLNASFALGRYSHWQFLKTNSINTLFFGGVLYFPFQSHSPRLFLTGSRVGQLGSAPFSHGLPRGERGSKSKPFPVYIFKFRGGKCQIILQSVVRPDLTPNWTVRRNRWENKRCPFLKEILSSLKMLLRKTVPTFPRMRLVQDRPARLTGAGRVVEEHMRCVITALSGFGKHTCTVLASRTLPSLPCLPFLRPDSLFKGFFLSVSLELLLKRQNIPNF